MLPRTQYDLLLFIHSQAPRDGVPPALAPLN